MRPKNVAEKTSTLTIHLVFAQYFPRLLPAPLISFCTKERAHFGKYCLRLFLVSAVPVPTFVRDTIAVETVRLQASDSKTLEDPFPGCDNGV